jgi:hypothetical protein
MSTLADFASAGIRPRTPLAKAISVALLVKLCVVIAMRIFLFGAEQRPHTDADVLASRVLGSVTPATEANRK